MYSASATAFVDTGSIPDRVKSEYKNWYSQLGVKHLKGRCEAFTV